MLYDLSYEEIEIITRHRDKIAKEFELAKKKFYCDHSYSFKCNSHNFEIWECCKCGVFEER